AAGTRARGARRRRHIPGVPVPGGNPRREQHLLPAQRAQRATQGARRGGARFDAVPQAGAREAVGAAPGRQAAAPRRQRGFLRRREEAQRDLPAGGAGAAAGDPRRNRLGPGHRRAQARRRRRQRAALARSLVRGDHALPAAARLHPAGRGARAGRRPHRRERRTGTGAGAGAAWLRLDRRPRRAGSRRVSSPLLDSLASGFGGDATQREQLEAVLRDGLPGPRTESWKYTPLRALERREFAPAQLQQAAIDPALLDAIPAPRLVFVNGRHDAALSRLDALPAGVELAATASETAYGEEAPADAVFARLNAALAQGGVRLRVPAGVEVDVPVHLVFVGAPAEADLAWHLRHRVELGEDASLRLMEHHLDGAAHRHLDNQVLAIEVGARATLLHARVQHADAGATLFLRTDARLGEDARYHRVDLELGGALSRHELNVRLEGDRAELAANGVLLADGRRH